MRDRIVLSSNPYSIRVSKIVGGKRACAIPTKCHTPATKPHSSQSADKWEEFVIRYDREASRYITLTACCPGAPVNY